ncbi:MAG TPA: hydrogenase maturation protease [Streptosporangiaceae bacterium]|nr:hydrogenase maturation protease [Streptosporangiaceae bacterium]
MKTLVAGVGNVFLGDDGFGVEVARKLAGDAAREGVRIADYGIRGLHLAYELMDGYDALILVDAVSRGGDAGTVYVIEPEVDVVDAAPMDAHGMNPEAVLTALASLGGTLDRVVVVGCEAADVSEGIGLSPPVASAVDGAANIVRDLLDDLQRGTSNER